MGLWLPPTHKDPLAYPGQIPIGIDSANPAAIGLHSSIVALGANVINLSAGANTGTVSGAPAAGIDGKIGPFVKFAASTDNIKFSGQSTANDATQTMAAIVVMTSVAAGTKTIFSNSGTGSQGYKIQIVTATVNGGGGTTQVSSGITLSANIPYFIAVSMKTGATKFAVVNLQTGAVNTASIGTAYTAVAPDGTYIVGNGPTTAASNCKIAAVMNSSAYSSAAQLLAWAADPWSFWYPDFDFPYVGVVAASAIQFRKTLSGIGGRVGSRQPIAWGA